MTTSKKRFGIFSLSAAASIALMLAAGLVSTPVQVHGQIVLGTITGTVTDEQGTALSNVDISVKDQDSGVSQSIRTDAHGVFTLRVAPGDNFSVTARLATFEKVIAKKLPIPLGGPISLDIKLNVASHPVI